MLQLVVSSSSFKLTIFCSFFLIHFHCFSFRSLVNRMFCRRFVHVFLKYLLMTKMPDNLLYLINNLKKKNKILTTLFCGKNDETFKRSECKPHSFAALYILLKCTVGFEILT